MIVNSHTTAPLTREQEQIWRACRLQSGAAYNIAAGVRFRGPIGAAAAIQAVEHVIRRHAPLRSYVIDSDAQPVLKVAPTAAFPLIVVDLARLAAATRVRWIRRLRRQHAARPLRWDRPPLLAGLLVSWGAHEGDVSCVIHHLASDSWSMIRFFGEFVRTYARYLAGHEAGLAPLAFDYLDYARRQQRWLMTDERARQQRFWQQRVSRDEFRPIWDATTLPVRGARRSSPSGGVVELTLPPDVRAALRRLQRTSRATLFMLLQAALHVAVQKWTGACASRIAVVDASRGLPEAEPLIGPFANVLLLEARTEPETRVERFVATIRDATAIALANRDYPYGLVLDMLDAGRAAPGETPFQAMLVQQSLDLPREAAAALPIEVEDVHNGAAKFPLTIYARDRGDTIRLTAEYATERFDARKAAALLAQYAAIVRHMADRPHARVVDLGAPSPAERHWAIHELNDTREDGPQAPLLEQFEAHARNASDRVALQGGDVCLTFGALARLAAAAGRGLCGDRGEEGGGRELVGVFFERSVEMVVAVLGVLSARCAFLPLSPEHPAAATRRRIARSGARRVLCKPRDAARVVEMGGVPVPMDDECRLTGVAETVPSTHAAAPCAPAECAVSPAAIYVMFTSGSTGEPKGAVLPHRGLENRIGWMRDYLAVGPSDRVLLKTPITFDVSMWELLLPLSSGCALIVAGPQDHRDSPRLAALIRDRQITIVHFVPTVAVAFCDERAARECRALRHVVLSGEALPGSLLKRLADTLSARVHNLYGPTEASIDVTAWTATAASVARPPIGRPIWNTTVRVLDRALAPVAAGVEGDLYLGGAGLALGYVRAPALTAASFVPDPFSSMPGARLYRTGDRVRMRHDGMLDFIGRRDGQVKVNGVRIELGEIEEALRRHPHVADAAAVIVPRPGPASGLPPRLESVAVLKPGHCQDLHERLALSETLRELLAVELSYGTAVASVMVVERLPLSPSGKTDKRALVEMIETGGIDALCADLLNRMDELSDEDAARLLAGAGDP